MVGSFLNVVIHRLPKMMERTWREQCAEISGDDAALFAEPKYNLVVPGSACPACSARITPMQNVPVLSYIFLGGRCANCRAPIGLRYPIVEAITGGISGFLAWHFGFG